MNFTQPTMMNQQDRKSPHRSNADAWRRSAALGAATLLAVGLVGATVALQKVAPGPSAAQTTMLLAPDGKRNGIGTALGIEFEYVHADLEFEDQRLNDVGVRYKGNGTFMESRDSLKRSLKIETDKYVKFIDLPEFARFMAVMVYLSDLDEILGPGQNLYLHLHPRSGQFAFIPWDQDH